MAKYSDVLEASVCLVKCSEGVESYVCVAKYSDGLEASVCVVKCSERMESYVCVAKCSKGDGGLPCCT